MNAVEKEISELVEKELLTANKMFPMFASDHEGYSVMLEELEECKDEIELIEAHLIGMWRMIKANGLPEENAGRIKNYAVNLAVEAIQVAAMAQKFIDSSKLREHKKIGGD
ncbi:MAG: hypothetical protein K0S04_320 [Herbinix sp.]|jgi:hypothetical protein|nr:hypothetical protein [Herbinix sp.]